MAGGSVFITGGTGFFGIWLLETLAWANARLKVGVRATVLSRDPKAFFRRAPHLAANSALSFVAGDVRDFSPPTSRYTHLVHAAFDSSRAITNPLAAFDTLTQGTRRMLEFAAAQPVERMLFVSSGAVYGPQAANVEHVPESCLGGPDTLAPASAYAEGKRTGEFLCGIAASNGLPVTIARCFAFMGPGLPIDSHFAAGNFLRDAHRGGDIVVKGDGSAVRSYLYAADLAIWLWTILLRGQPGRAYNVGSDQGISVGDLARMIATRAPTLPAVRILLASVGGPPERYVPDTGRASNELGLRQLIPLPASIDRTLNWLGETRQ
jgi:dTDP-glucose 4,6-dehydratase